MAKEKIWPHPLAPVWLNLGDPQGHTIGISNFFVFLSLSFFLCLSPGKRSIGPGGELAPEVDWPRRWIGPGWIGPGWIGPGFG